MRTPLPIFMALVALTLQLLVVSGTELPFDERLTETVTSHATAANASAGAGHGHRSADFCADVNPTCKLQGRADCKKEDCSSAITAIIFPFLALAIGIFLQPMTKYIRKIPYTIFLLISGFILGLIGCRVDMGFLSTSLRQWIHLEPPNLFFYLFLAPLIFEAAFVTRWHIFKRLLIPILCAAFLIVALQAGLISGFTMLVTNSAHGWTWWSALMFGAMLSATDPISVTATLKALGASENLGTLIEGESLVNDGSAFVLWETFFHNTEALGDSSIKSYSIGDIIGIIVKSSVGGMALGILFALVALIILTFVYDEFEVETSLTVVVAFVGFWAAQSPAKLSGVICNVASGLMLSAYGRPLISQSVRHPLAEFWELLGWAANTIVFVHSGVLTIAFVWPCASTPLYIGDYFLILGYFAFLQVIRVALFMIFLPILSYKNKWFTWRECLVVGLSGLRGAVSLILALNVAGAAPIPSEIRTRVFVWTTGIVALSLLVNGMAIPFLLRILGLDGANSIREDFLSRARATMTQQTLSTLDALTVDLSYTGARWSYVVKSVVPKKWLQDDESGSHYARAAEQMTSNVASQRLSLEFMVKEHTRATIEADIRTRTSTEMFSAPVSDQQPTRLSLSHPPLERRVAPPPLTTAEKMGTPRHSTMEQLRNPFLRTSARPFSTFDPAGGVGSFGPHDSLQFDFALHGNENNDLRQQLSVLRKQQNFAAEKAEYEDEDEDEYIGNHNIDREVRRRMLMNMLSHVRHLSNHTFVEYSALVTLEEEIMTALDENDENREYDMFTFLEQESTLGQILGRCFTVKPSQLEAKRIATAVVLFQIMSEILKQEGLSRSRVVRIEAENLYEGAAFSLNKNQDMKAFRWIVSQCAVHAVTAHQDAALHDLFHGGVIDEYEHKVIIRELQDVRRHHSVFTRGEWKKSTRKAGELVAKHPMFADHNSIFDEVTKLPTVTLPAGQPLQMAPGTLVVVMSGAIKPAAKQSISDETQERRVRTLGTHIGYGGSVRHWINSRFTGYLGPSIACAINNEPGDECSVAMDRLTENVFVACDPFDETIVYTLPGSVVRSTAAQSKAFRDEVTRFMARDFVLSSLKDEKPYHLRLINEALANKIDESTWSGRAFSLLEKLPYMTVVQIRAGQQNGAEESAQASIRGPGILVNGTVRVSVVDTSGLDGATNLLHEHLEGPALLPSENLIIQEVAGSREPNGGRNVNGGRGNRQTHDLGPVLAHVLIMEQSSIDKLARARLDRWTGDDDTIDMNGRFGMAGHITNRELKKTIEQQSVTEEVPELSDSREDLNV